MTWPGESQRHSASKRSISTRGQLNTNNMQQSKFFKLNTGIPIQQDMMENPKYFKENKGILWKIVWLTPKEYEQAIERGFRGEARFYHKSNPIPLSMDVREFRIHPEHLKKIKKIMKQKKMSMPFLRYSVFRSLHEKDKIDIAFDQEGHYRTVAADEFGAEKIPVFLEYPSSKEHLDMVKRLMSTRVEMEVVE